MSAHVTNVTQPRGYRQPTYTTSSTSYVPAIAVTGSGRLSWVSLQCSTLSNIRLTIDGVVLGTAATKSTTATCYLQADMSAAFTTFCFLDMQFKQSLLVEISVNAGGTATANIGYEI
ncbi:hypothetical protein EL26_01680 [Tumebacillus flagellatus]|uniref:Uncharacterized protein n=1 Tax=Tumebacillus flagellatus TaxID=1157490 RepID=A0A074LW00_9BACL|nr:hypothetical protein EL26_01680 [Tumebacillus flagellatus]